MRALADPSIPPPPFKPVLQPSASAASLWKVVSDSQLGGKSNGAVECCAPPSHPPPAHLRFSGTISLELGGRLSSSGFCGCVGRQQRSVHVLLNPCRFISHPQEFEHNLEDYDGTRTHARTQALALVCRAACQHGKQRGALTAAALQVLKCLSSATEEPTRSTSKQTA